MVLAVSALHSAFLRPNQGQRYTEIAQRHFGVGMPLFRASLSASRREDSHLLYGCSQLVAKYSFANEAHPERALFLPTADPVGNWMILNRGAYIVRGENQPAPRQLAVDCFAIDQFAPISAPLPEGYEHELDHLSRLLEDLPNESRNVYISVVHLLRQLFAFENDSNCDAKSKSLLLAALAKIPPTFLLAVEAGEPRAIIIVAHFCIMFEKVNNDHFWYMRNWSRLIFEECNKRLESSLKVFLAWPSSFFDHTL